MIEQETTITFNREEPNALVGSASESVKNKLKKLGAEIHRNDGDWITFSVPKDWIKIRPKKRVSEAQREGMADRMRKMQETIRNQKPVS